MTKHYPLQRSNHSSKDHHIPQDPLSNQNLFILSLYFFLLKCELQCSFLIRIKFKNLKIMLQYFSQAKPLEDNSYTIEDFLFRWKKLERVLVKEGVDGLLLATGLDARDCVHSAYLFNWLFLGLSGKNITINKYLDPVYSEMIVVISPHHNYVFITPEAKDMLETLIYAIPNCTVFCPTSKQYSNKELLDTLKIAQFYQMVEKVNKIGVFLGDHEDVKSIEKWPLIQSYALEPVGKTFFTLKHQAINIGSKVSNLFKNFDKHALKNLAGRTSYSMEGHIKGAVTAIELKNVEQRANISELALQQSLQEAVDIGLFQSGSTEYKGLVRVLIGRRTGQTDTISDKVTIGDENADHFTIEHFDPYTKLKVWRSYFLNLNLKREHMIKMQAKQEQDSFLTKYFYSLLEEPNTRFDEQSCLISLYLHLVHGVLDSIASVSKDYRHLNKEFINQLVLGKLNQCSVQLYKKQIFKAHDLIVQIESFDSFGEPKPIDFKDSISFKLTTTFYCIKCRIKNVPSPRTQKSLGSLIFSESFIIQEGCYLLLTKDIPYFDFWKCGGAQDPIIGNLNPNYEFAKLGQPISNQGYKNRMFLPSEKMSAYHFNIPLLNVTYYFHENGLRIYNEKIGWHLLFYEELHDLTMVNKIPGQWVIMKISSPFLFYCLETHIVAFEFRGKPFDHLMALTKRKENPLSLTFIEDIPPVLGEDWYFSEEILKKSAKEGAYIHHQQILIKDFLWSFIESKQLMVINQMKDIKLMNFKSIYQKKAERKRERIENEAKTNILVINGTYGSGKYRLATNLKRFGPNDLKCDIFNIPPDNLFSKVQPETFIEMIEQFIQSNQIPSSKSHLAIIVIPSWLNCTILLPMLSAKFHVRSVLTKINSSNFFENKNMSLVEDVLAFALPGYCQNIIIDSYSEEESLINSVIKIGGTFNREVRVSRCTNSLLTTGQCIDILEDTSYESQYQTFLRQKYGAFYSFPQLVNTCLNYIEFNLPLYDLKKLKNLNKLHGYLINRSAILKQLQPKKKEAENSKDELMLGLYFLEEVMTVVRRRAKAPRIRSVKGYVKVRKNENDPRCEEFVIKDIAWANDEFRENQTNGMGRPFGFSILSNRYDEMQVRKLIESLSYKNALFGEAQELKVLQALTEGEIKTIEEKAIIQQKHFENGEYYDGYVLRNAEGFAIEGHPNLNKVLESWVVQENQQIMKRNAEMKQRWVEYCKQYDKA